MLSLTDILQTAEVVRRFVVLASTDTSSSQKRVKFSDIFYSSPKAGRIPCLFLAFILRY